MLKGGLVAHVDGSGQYMDTSILLFPIPPRISCQAELFRHDLLQRLHRVFVDIASDSVVAERRIVMRHLVNNQGISTQQINGFADLWIVCVVWRMHGLVN